jgi:hypothetical protein
MHQEEILLRDHQETWRNTSFRQLFELEERNIHAHRSVKTTPDVAATQSLCIKETASREWNAKTFGEFSFQISVWYLL